MISLHRANFLNNTPSVPGRSLGSTRLTKRGPVAVRVAVGPSKGRSVDGSGVVVSEEGGGNPVVEVSDKSTVAGGGVEDVYGEDFATEDQVVTPWALSVAR